MKLVIKKAHLGQMINHAEREYPNEACGILAGRDRRVRHVYEMTNVETSPVKYLLDLKEQFAVVKDMRKKNMEMLAIFHSHPDSKPHPSWRDIELALYTDASYVIVSVMNGVSEVRSYRINNGIVTEEEIEVKQ